MAGEQDGGSFVAPLLANEVGRPQNEQGDQKKLSRSKTLMNAAVAAALFMAPADDRGDDPTWEVKHADLTDRPPRGFRILDRSGPFRQSRGRLNIHRIHRDQELFLADPFHTLVEMPTLRLLTSFWILYCLTFALFAFVYWAASSRCGIGCDTYLQALCLSVETMLTIGFGVPDPYFRPCPWLVVVLVMQCLIAVLFDSLFVGIVYQRLSRGTTRASTILFSDKASIRAVGDALFLTFRVCEMHRTQLLDSHFRCYLFTWQKGASSQSGQSSSRFGQALMRLEHPDDSLGGHAMLILPFEVVHRIDAFSPLMGTGPDRLAGSLGAMARQPAYAPLQRDTDALVGSRDSVWCAVCGQSYPRREQLRRHIEFTAEEETREGSSYTPHVGLLDTEEEDFGSLQDIRSLLAERMDSLHMEVVCILEGVDAKTSSSVQVRHSYTVEDMVWDSDFAPCVQADGNNEVMIDFAKFHDMVACG